MVRVLSRALVEVQTALAVGQRTRVRLRYDEVLLDQRRSPSTHIPPKSAITQPEMLHVVSSRFSSCASARRPRWTCHLAWAKSVAPPSAQQLRLVPLDPTVSAPRWRTKP